MKTVCELVSLRCSTVAVHLQILNSTLGGMRVTDMLSSLGDRQTKTVSMEKTLSLGGTTIFTLVFTCEYMTAVSFICRVPLGQTSRKYFMSNPERFRNAFMFNLALQLVIMFDS